MQIRRRPPVHEQVYREIKKQIIAGKLADGERIEARSKLAGTKTMPVSLRSLNRAFARLRDDGWVETRRGQPNGGTFVIGPKRRAKLLAERAEKGEPVPA